MGKMDPFRSVTIHEVHPIESGNPGYLRYRVTYHKETQTISGEPTSGLEQVTVEGEKRTVLLLQADTVRFLSVSLSSNPGREPEYKRVNVYSIPSDLADKLGGLPEHVRNLLERME